jgi:hypothetical protein
MTRAIWYWACRLDGFEVLQQGHRRISAQPSRSKMAAIPWPPPMHMVTSA